MSDDILSRATPLTATSETDEGWPILETPFGQVAILEVERELADAIVQAVNERAGHIAALRDVAGQLELMAHALPDDAALAARSIAAIAESALSGAPSPEPSAVPEIHTPEPSERVGKMDPYEAAMDHLRTQNAELTAHVEACSKRNESDADRVAELVAALERALTCLTNRGGDPLTLKKIAVEKARAAIAKAKGDDA